MVQNHGMMRIEITIVQMTVKEMHSWLAFTGDIFCSYDIKPLQAKAWKWFMDGAQ